MMTTAIIKKNLIDKMPGGRPTKSKKGRVNPYKYPPLEDVAPTGHSSTQAKVNIEERSAPGSTKLTKRERREQKPDIRRK